MPVDTPDTPDRYAERDGRRYEVTHRSEVQDYGERVRFVVERVREVTEEER